MMMKAFTAPGLELFRAITPDNLLMRLDQLLHRETPMNTVDELLDPEVLRNLATEIGHDNVRLFMDSLDTEFHKRIENMREAIADESFVSLSAQAHALKSSAQISGAVKLSEVLVEIERQAKDEVAAAFELARQAITIADLTRFAFLDVKFED